MRSASRRWWSYGAMALGLALMALALLTCDGRSIGVEDPTADGHVPPHPDAYVPPIPDAALPPVPDAAPGCEGSPVRGHWQGTFTGEVDSSTTGPMTVQGTVQIDIFCEETLQVHGVMEGAESSGIPFEAEVSGEYDEEHQLVWATWEGTVYVVPASGLLEGAHYESPVERISGTWRGTAPDVDGTGAGSWTVYR